ncbi:hypothetical protein M3Y94_01028600 [Aphelenchoides besseyi]|nr:hypothetical protein M3Y94_01028600 [Aphelenchoides besseyi]
MENVGGFQSQIKEKHIHINPEKENDAEIPDVFESEELDMFLDEKTIFFCFKPSIEFSTTEAFPTQWVEQRWEVQNYDELIRMGIEPIWNSQPFALSQLFEGKFDVCHWPDMHAVHLLFELDDTASINLEYELWHEDENAEADRSSKAAGHILFSSDNDTEHCQFYDEIYPEDGSLFICFKARLWIEREDTSMPRLDVSGVYGNANFTDLEICVGEAKLKASKSILCLQSEVFYRMFTYPSKEKATGIVNIKNFDAQVVEKMLIFVYFGKVDDLSSWAHRLLKIADYYEIHELIHLCVNSISKDLSMDNFFETFLLSLQLSHLGHLKIHLMEFAKYHRQEIVNHPQIDDFIFDNLEATRELLQVFAS